MLGKDYLDHLLVASEAHYSRTKNRLEIRIGLCGRCRRGVVFLSFRVPTRPTGKMPQDF
jgi:hypothetical protein